MVSPLSVYRTPLVSLVATKQSQKSPRLSCFFLGFSGLGPPTIQKQHRPPPATSPNPGGKPTLLPALLPALWSPGPRTPVQSGPGPFPSQVALKFSFCQFNSVIDEEEQEKWPGTAGFPVSPSRDSWPRWRRLSEMFAERREHKSITI